MQRRLQNLSKNLLLRILCTAIILAGGIAACSFSSKAADEPTYTLTYEIIGSDETEKTAKVTGFEGEASGALIIPDTVEIEGKNYKVTSIGDGAFAQGGFDGRLKIGVNVEKIGANAFDHCSKLIGDLVIPDSVISIEEKAFYYCEGFAGTITIGSNVESIGTSAFEHCYNLSGQLIVPDSVENVGNYPFSMCHSLTSVAASVPCSFHNKSLSTLGIVFSCRPHDFDSEGVCDENKKTCKLCGAMNIGYKDIKVNITNPTYDGSELAPTVLIEDGEKTLEEGTDYELVYETKTDVGKYEITINGINDYAGTINTSWYITSYKLNAKIISETKTAEITGVSGDASGELVIPDTVEIDGKIYKVTSIGNYAFERCSNLSRELVIPDSVESIGNDAFANCSGFTKLILGKNVKSIGDYAFFGCEKLSGELVIPDSVESIGNDAFAECHGFKKLTLGKKVNSIGHIAFANCSNLSGELVIPDSVESIGNDAFLGCYGFTKLTLGKKVNVIGERAFWCCSNLEGDVIIPDSVTSIGENAFSECKKITSISLSCKIDTLSLNIGHDYVIRHDFEKDAVYDMDKRTCEACGKKNICCKDIKVNITNPTYDDSELAPTVDIKDGIYTLVEETDYELVYEKHSAIGEYEMTVKGVNEYAGTIKKTWSIVKATPTFEVPTNLKGKCGDKLSTITFEDSHMTWEDSTCVMTGDEESSKPITRTFKAIYTPDDTEHYEIATFDVNVEISHVKASPVKENNVAPTYEKDGSYDEVVYCEKCKTELSRDKKTVDKLVKPAPDDPNDPDDSDSPDVPVGLENGDVINLAKQKCMIMVSDVKKHEASYYKSTNKKAKTVSVPATVKIDGITFKVTAISDNAFKNNTKATKIVIPSNVKKLGKNLFKNLKKLKTIEIKSTKLTKKTIDKKTFAGLNKKATIKVPKKKLKAYKKLFKAKGLNKKIKVK